MIAATADTPFLFIIPRWFRAAALQSNPFPMTWTRKLFAIGIINAYLMGLVFFTFGSEVFYVIAAVDEQNKLRRSLY